MPLLKNCQNVSKMTNLGYPISVLLPVEKWNVQRYFVCLQVSRLSQPIGVMSSAVSLSNHTFTGQA